MKNTICLLLAGLVVAASYGQSSQGGRAIYRFNHLRDTNSTQLYTEDMMLEFSSAASLYKNYTRFKEDSTRRSESPSTGRVTRTLPWNREQIFIDFKSGLIQTVIPWIGDTLMINQPNNQISWEVKDSSTIIAGLQCKLATGLFKGRTYSVWYTQEVPVSIGPWKLCGLPGLIVQATDTRGHVSFALTSIKNISSVESIRRPDQPQIIDQEQYKRMQDELLANPQAVLQRASSQIVLPPGATVSRSLESSGGVVKPNEGVRRKVINNPLELTP